MARAGRFLGLISPILAVGVAALILFGFGYSYESASCRASMGHQSTGSEGCTYESGTVSMFRSALEEADHALFYWAGIVIAVCVIAAVSALAGKSAPVWICACILLILAGLGTMSLIGLFLLPLAFVLFASATLLTLDGYESRIP